MPWSMMAAAAPSTMVGVGTSSAPVMTRAAAFTIVMMAVIIMTMMVMIMVVVVDFIIVVEVKLSAKPNPIVKPRAYPNSRSSIINARIIVVIAILTIIVFRLPDASLIAAGKA